MVKFLFSIVLALVLAGCAPQATVTPPSTPTPQVTVLQADRTLADALNATVKTVISLRDRGMITQAETRLVESYCQVAAQYSDEVATVMSTGDWTTQKSQLQAVTKATVFPVLTQKLGTTASSAIQQIIALVTQIVQQVMAP